MAYNSTAWSIQGNTKAGATSSTTDALTTGALTVSGTGQFSNTLTVGVDDTGYDVKFFGDTASNYMLWDTSTDNLKIVTTHNNTALLIQSDATRSTADAPDIAIRKYSIPNDNDYLGSIKFESKDAGDTNRIYAEVDVNCKDADDGAADGSLILSAISHGTLTQGFKVRSTNNGSSAEVEAVAPTGVLVSGTNTTNQGILELKRKDADEFGYIKMYSADATASYLFVANDGTLRIHSSVPTANGDGSAV